jgi:hypothetical protein
MAAADERFSLSYLDFACFVPPHGGAADVENIGSGPPDLNFTKKRPHREKLVKLSVTEFTRPGTRLGRAGCRQ